MRVPQQPAEAIQDQLIALNTIAGLVLVGVVLVFLGWLKYKDRNNPTKKSRKRWKQKTRQK